MKYTALEILKLTDIESPENVIGKFGVNIAGVTVNTPDHIINMQDAKTAKLIVAKKAYEVDLPEQESHSEDVQKALEAKGRKATKVLEARKERAKKAKEARKERAKKAKEERKKKKDE